MKSIAAPRHASLRRSFFAPSAIVSLCLLLGARAKGVSTPASPSAGADWLAEAASPKNAAEILLKSTTVRTRDFNGETLGHALEIVSQKCLAADPQKHGVKISLSNGATTLASTAIPNLAFIAPEISAYDALKSAISWAHCRLEITDNGVVVFPVSQFLGAEVASLEFRDVTVAEAVERLGAKSREIDPAGRGVNLVMAAGARPAANQTRVTLAFHDDDLESVLDSVVEEAGLEVEFHEGAIFIREPALHFSQWQIPPKVRAALAGPTGSVRPWAESIWVEFPPGAGIAWDESKRLLSMRNTQWNTHRVDLAVRQALGKFEAQSVPLPSFDLTQGTIFDALNGLKAKLAELGAANKRINWMVAGGEEHDELENHRFDLHLQETTLRGALQELALAADLGVSIQPSQTVCFSAKHGWETRTYVIEDPALLNSMRQARQFAEANGVRFLPGSSISWDESKKHLTMSNTAEQQNLLGEALTKGKPLPKPAKTSREDH